MNLLIALALASIFDAYIEGHECLIENETHIIVDHQKDTVYLRVVSCATLVEQKIPIGRVAPVMRLLNGPAHCKWVGCRV